MWMLRMLTEGLCAFTWLDLLTVRPWEKEYSWNFGIWFLVVKNSHQEKNLKSGISKDNDNEIYRFPFCNMIQTLFTWLHLTQVPILEMDVCITFKKTRPSIFVFLFLNESLFTKETRLVSMLTEKSLAPNPWSPEDRTGLF